MYLLDLEEKMRLTEYFIKVFDRYIEYIRELRNEDKWFIDF